MLADELNTKESSGLLSAVDRMREILHNEKITLPEIVVVGDQSVGKSSVLEAISGIQLPRAQNICTRCPLELRMKSTTGDEYAIIRSSKRSEDEAEKIADLGKISETVTRLTEEIAGRGINVSSIPIYLTVYKRNIPYELTLIDLPGITRNAQGDQAEDIHTQILDLINKYIEPPTAVVLHVIPSSTDFTTSESMKLAKTFDPQCLRQLIAASKIDKYDKGIAEKLLGYGAGAMPLKLGCVAVLNRNQEEIEQNVSFEQMKQREAQFFLKHRDAFQNLPDEFKGIDQLVKKLATIQQDRIRSTFSQIIEELRKQIREKKLELKSIPISMTSEKDCWSKFQSMIDALRESIRAKVNGDYDLLTRMTIFSVDGGASSRMTYPLGLSDNLDESTMNSMPGDDRLAYNIHKFQRRFQEEIMKSFSDFHSVDYYKLVLQAIDDAAGVSLPNFPSYHIIERLFRAELTRLPNICSSLVEGIRDYLKESILRIFYQTFDIQYVRLIERLKDVIIEKIDAAEDRANERVQETLDMEFRVFTLNNEYMFKVKEMNNEQQKKKEKETEGKAVPPPTTITVTPPSTIPSKPSANILSSTSNSNSVILPAKLIAAAIMVPETYSVSFNEALSAVDIQIALDSYSKIVQKRLIDTISEICYHHFITRCALAINQDLTLACPSSDLVRFMKEPPDQTNRRENLMRTIKAYEEALRLGQQYL